MKRAYWTTLIGTLVVCLAALAWPFLWRTPPRDLVHVALKAEKVEDRANAVVELAMRKEPNPLPDLRRLLAESKDPQVLSQVISALAARMDGQSWDQFLEALHHPDREVRYAASRGFARLAGISDGEMDIDREDPGKFAEALRGVREKYKGRIDPKEFKPDRRTPSPGK